MAVVTMKQLLDSGAHFGHQTRRWNPKMKRFIFTDRNGIYIIDLQQTLVYIDRAFEFVKETVAHGGTLMFIGTKKQAQESIAEQATRVGMPYVNQRWLGGMLTNFQTVHKRLLRLKELESMEQTGGFEGRTKKEILMLTREMTKLDRTLGGIRDMSKVPSAVWIVDTNKEHLAVAEARKLNIPVVAILDTNCDPDVVDYPIPGNDDAIRSAALLTKVVATAVADGLQARGGASSESRDAGEPLAEWEQELLATASAEGSTTATEPTVAADPSTTGSPATATATQDVAGDAATQAVVPQDVATPAARAETTGAVPGGMTAGVAESTGTTSPDQAALTEQVEAAAETAAAAPTESAESAVGGTPTSDTQTPPH